MGVKRSVSEAFAFVLAEEATFAERDVINLVARTSAVQFHPRLLGLLAFSVQISSRDTFYAELQHGSHLLGKGKGER